MSHDEIDLSQLVCDARPLSFHVILDTEFCVILCSKVSSLDVPESMAADCASLGYAFFKFEPFILHCMCRSLEDAQALVGKGVDYFLSLVEFCAFCFNVLQLQLAVGCGFRNSGISFGKKGKIMVVSLSQIKILFF